MSSYILHKKELGAGDRTVVLDTDCIRVGDKDKLLKFQFADLVTTGKLSTNCKLS